MNQLKRSLALALALALTTIGGVAVAGPGYGPANGPSLDKAIAGPLVGKLKVRNDRMRPVTVYVDGERAVKLGPNESKVLRNLPNGVRQVSVAGKRGPVETSRVRIGIGDTAKLRIAPRFGTASIINSSGLMLGMRLNGERLGKVYDGKRIDTGPLAPGPHTLVARAPNGGPTVTKTIHVRPGQRETVRLAPMLGEVSVRNPFPFKVKVYIDDVRVAKLQPNQSTVITGRLPGATRIIMKKRRRVVASSSINVVAGARADFAPQVAMTGSVRVHNGARRPLSVQLNGKNIGYLQPGATKVVDRVSQGHVQVVGVSNSGRRITKTVYVQPYREALVELNRPHHGQSPPPIQTSSSSW